MLIERGEVTFDNRSLWVTISYSCGGGRPAHLSFDFQNSSGAGPTP